MVNALLHSYVLLNTISTRLLGFKYVKALYANDSNFSKIYNACGHLAFDKFYLMDDYLFKENWLYGLASSLRELLVREAYEDGLIGHFRVAKTLNVLHKNFYWLKMKKNV